jgi:hypothetical protein
MRPSTIILMITFVLAAALIVATVYVAVTNQDRYHRLPWSPV